MTKLGQLIAATGLTALSLLVSTGTVQAAAPLKPAGPTQAAAPDGYLYAWVNANRGGTMCRWYEDDANWNTCENNSSISMRNRASSLENRGYAGAYEDVDLFYSPGQEGSRNCLPNGRYLNNLTGIYFLWDGQPGQGQSMNDNIASHEWSNRC
ncbi:hypothetical protein ACIBBB_34810 [Streptomyces sp. NPDC051217]|uniref:hypothetical protein n=1 Tax=Streptomyces sp. NPDC051217 TaxID=3365644 RepID=UPI0037B0A854